MDVSAALTDPDLGFTAFTVQRITYTRQNGTSVPSVRTLDASGCIHPGAPEMIRLPPEEERHEEFIAVYTGFALSAGENDGGETWTAPDRILWNGETWRVAEVRNWSAFGYVQALAMRMQE